MRRGRHGTSGNRARVATIVVLLVGVVSSSAMADWQDVVEPELAGMVLEHAQGERVLIIQLDPRTSPDDEALNRAYTYTSARTWNAGQLSVYRRELAPWCEFVSGWSLRRVDHDIWERTSAYLAFAHAVIVVCEIGDIPSIGELSFVEHVLDGEREIAFAHVLPGTMGTDREVERRLADWWEAPAEGQEFSHRVFTQDWLLIGQAGLDALVGEPFSDLVLADEIDELAMQDQRIVGLGTPCPLESCDDPEAPPWPLCMDIGLLRKLAGGMTRSQLLQLTDAALHAGASSIALCMVEGSGEETPLAMMWAPVPQDGWAVADPDLALGDGATAGLPASVFPLLDIAATRGAHADYVLVEWDVAEPPEMVEVLRSLPDDIVFRSIGITPGRTFRDTDVETCVRYMYRVRVLSEDGVGVESEMSNGYVGCVPGIVSVIEASDGSEPNGVRIEWAAASDATEYVLYRSEPVDTPTQLSTRVYAVYRGAATEFLDTDVVSGTCYRYQAIPLNGCGSSVVGNPSDMGYAIHVEPSVGAISPPSWFRATLVSPEDHIEIMWCPVDGADEYGVYRASSYEGPYECIHRTSSTAWSDCDVLYCQDYFYRIQALNGDKESALSAVAHGVCGCKPGKPSEIYASEGVYPDSIRIEWQLGDQACWTSVLRASEPDGLYTKIADTDDCVYFDTGLVPGQAFWYRLVARNECGGSGRTSPVGGSTIPE